MGTRGAYGFYRNGISKISYNHFDSYPDGLGKDIVKYITSRSIDQMNKDFDAISLVKKDDKPTPEQFSKCVEFGIYDATVNEQSPEDFYCVLHGSQGDLDMHAKVGLMIDNSDFLADSLFCEWGYVINLDTNILEVYEGFQKKVTNTRYQPSPDSSSEYKGCALVAEISIDKNISKKFKVFIKSTEE